MVTDRPGQRVLQGPWSDMTHFVQAWDAMLVSESPLDLRRMAVSQDAEFPGTVWERHRSFHTSNRFCVGGTTSESISGQQTSTKNQTGFSGRVALVVGPFQRVVEIQQMTSFSSHVENWFLSCDFKTSSAFFRLQTSPNLLGTSLYWKTFHQNIFWNSLKFTRPAQQELGKYSFTNIAWM